MIPTSFGDGRRVPGFEIGWDIRPVRGEDGAHAPSEPTPLRLDQVADALVGTPLAGRRAPAAFRSERAHLELHGPRPRGQEVGDAIDAQRARFDHAGRSAPIDGSGAADSGELAPTSGALASAIAGGSALAGVWMTGSSPPSASQHAAA